MTLYLNALGIVNALGRGKRQVAANLFGGSRAGMVLRDDLIPGRSVRVGVIDGPLPSLPSHLADFDCRNNRVMLAALEEIEAAVMAARRRYGGERIAVVVGTSTAGIAEGEQALRARLTEGAWPRSYHYSQQELGNLSAFVAAYFDLSGPAYTIATACSSSGKAFASAQRLIEAGICDAALVGGADTLCRLTLNGFNSLEAIAADYCNPFSRNRDGINIGEGAAVFLLSREHSAVALLGVGESSDAHHVSAPDPAGRGALHAMRRALEAAGLPAASVDYVNFHGTATTLNDVMEGRVVAQLFGGDMPCSSTKTMTGHMLGAAAAGEAGMMWLALDPEYSGGALPPHLWDGAADPEIPALNLVPLGTRIPLGETCTMLSNSFAFGGSNVAVLLGRGW
ncbi:MAG TPA: beta-ketoacyl-[acyl-carrier-protein] synthase family protein [Stellaceae bacterium]|jgi:3-oxoacyl-[acyl-carrier-protein] synthase-1|nr:beta-ketoacyl-[acyl-carrier-protein] synthase family protein [Stellaceae bacterium]